MQAKLTLRPDQFFPKNLPNSKRTRYLVIGFDTEYQREAFENADGLAEVRNQVLSYQYSCHVITPDNADDEQHWSGIVLPDGPADDNRLPRKGNSTTHISEILLAKKLGAKIELVEGRRINSDRVFSRRKGVGREYGPAEKPFLKFARHCIEERAKHPKKSLNNLFWKELVNSTYGKTAQGLRERRMVEGFDVDGSEMAILTSDTETNELTACAVEYARVLITTHQMVDTRCAGQTFADTACFHYMGLPRQVRVWDEAMLPGEVVTLNTDDLQTLPSLLRTSIPSLGDFAGKLAKDMLEAPKGSTFEIPIVELTAGVELAPALDRIKQEGNENARKILEDLY